MKRATMRQRKGVGGIFRAAPQEAALASFRTAPREAVPEWKSGLGGVRLRTAPEEAVLIVQVLSQVLRKNLCSFCIQVLEEIFLARARSKARAARKNFPRHSCSSRKSDHAQTSSRTDQTVLADRTLNLHFSRRSEKSPRKTRTAARASLGSISSCGRPRPARQRPGGMPRPRSASGVVSAATHWSFFTSHLRTAELYTRKEDRWQRN